jgi:protein-S-isoprenylcysteine O-methyltransferase Ste14
MRVVDIVIGVGWVIFWVGWFAASAGAKRIYLGRNWGMPTSTKEDPELVTSGPYRTIRHPIYTGILLAMIGSAIAVSVWWLIAVALIGGYFIYSAFVEERNMTRLFPSAYPEYQQSTKMLIPFIF